MSGDSAKKLGQHIHHLREAQGLSIHGLASTAKVDFSWLSRLEHGAYESPDPRALYRVANALDVEPHEFYLLAGYEDGRGLPGFTPYLRAKYDLPDEAIAQLEAHFDLINEKYHTNETGDHHEHQPN